MTAKKATTKPANKVDEVTGKDLGAPEGNTPLAPADAAASESSSPSTESDVNSAGASSTHPAGEDAPTPSYGILGEGVSDDVKAQVEALALIPADDTTPEEELLDGIKAYLISSETRLAHLNTGMFNATAGALRCLDEAAQNLAAHIAQQKA